MPSATYALIRDAMTRRDQVHATYQGLHRELCVHEIGIGPNGNEQILSYQFGGETSKGPVTSVPEKARWRCMALSELSSVRAVGGKWHTGANRGAGNFCIEHTDLAIHP